MCGIAGGMNFNDKPFSSKLLRSMCNGMQFRGPDDMGYFVDGVVGIGMVRLAIQDVANGHQPMFAQNGKLALVFNGEIYNFLELRAQLEDKGYSFNTSSDTEVILHLYQEFGRDCVKYLNGMFSIAIWDGNLQEMWVVRDRVGIKPLYYFNDHESFGFSSDLLSLRCVKPLKISNDSLLTYLLYGYVPAPATIFHNIYKLEPGCGLIITADSHFEKYCYWNSGILTNSNNIKNISTVVNDFDRLLKSSVSLQLRSDVPVGMFLSGGLDSSLIAKIASEMNSNLTVYTAKFEGKDNIDSDLAKRIASDLNLTYKEVFIDTEKLDEALDKIVETMDEPIADNALLPTYILSNLARVDGVKVLLTGAGADEVFGGYERHLKPRFGGSHWFAELPIVLKGFLSFFIRWVKSDLFFRTKSASRNFFLSISGASITTIKDYMKESSIINSYLSEIDEIKIPDKGRKSKMYLDFLTYLPDNILSLTDKASMASSVECRVPYLDHRLVEAAYMLKDETFLNGTETKALLRTLAKLHLPSYLIDREKEGFNASTASYVSTILPKIVDNLKYELSPCLKELFDFSDLSIEKLNKSKVNFEESLYSLYVLNLWAVKNEL